jgi:protein-L-isoaspartate(D-aspartate) O-methyltransferase
LKRFTKRQATDEYAEMRRSMVENQLVTRSVKDVRVLDVMRGVPRHLFVEDRLGRVAYDDYPLPIGEGQTISQPFMVAAMTEALKLISGDRVLEVGTGSGYQTAILAELVDEVYTVERIPSIAEAAKVKLISLGYRNIRFRTGNGACGWKEESPFEKILVTAGSPGIPKRLFDQLTEKGRMVIPVGDMHSQVLTVVSKVGGEPKRERLFSCVFVPLVDRDGSIDFIGA